MASFPTPKRIPFSSQVFPILLEQLENPFMSSAEGMHKPVGCTSVISRLAQNNSSRMMVLKRTGSRSVQQGSFLHTPTELSLGEKSSRDREGNAIGNSNRSSSSSLAYTWV
eukprot:TRINITY_DN6744_c0_g2_i4.p1 TRINITY_DN6744_c0_g2~~TRINITY_DN6744_c0_g2_i4.p1  ORF type:complete len:111 (+),score=20.40 TRINITY_DN6744_c0_g2_i4:282-614(+)